MGITKKIVAHKTKQLHDHMIHKIIKKTHKDGGKHAVRRVAKFVTKRNEAIMKEKAQVSVLIKETTVIHTTIVTLEKQMVEARMAKDVVKMKALKTDIAAKKKEIKRCI